MNHVESIDCPCKPVTLQTLGGGRAQFHRGDAGQGQREPATVTCPHCAGVFELGVPDPYCAACDAWHLRGKHVS